MGTILDLTSGAREKSRPSSGQHAIEAKPADAQLLAERQAQQRTAERARLEQELQTLRKRAMVVVQTLTVLEHPELRAPMQEIEALLNESSASQARLHDLSQDADEPEQVALRSSLENLHQQREALNQRISELELAQQHRERQRREDRRAAHVRNLERLAQAVSHHQLQFASAGVSVHALFPQLAQLSSEELLPDALNVLPEDVADDELLDALEPPAQLSALPPPLSAPPKIEP